MASVDAVVVQRLLDSTPTKLEIGQKLVTLAFGGLYLAATTPLHKPLLVWEAGEVYARYYIPTESLHSEVKRQLAGDVNGNVQELSSTIKSIETFAGANNDSQATIEELTVGNRSTKWIRFLSGPFKDHIRFEKDDLDQWFENGAIFVSIKNPYKRIDTTTVSQAIVVKVDGEIVAETAAATLLNETGQPAVYYLPATSIQNWGAIEKSNLRTACPYKGEAWYLSLTVRSKKYENLIWYYQYPTHESAGVEGLIGFVRKPEVEFSVDGTII